MSKKILIVEDEADLRELAKQQLEDAGFQVVAATDGEHGLEIVQEHLVDLIVLDVQMPFMDGYTFLKKLRRIDERLKTIPVIMLTGKEKLESIFQMEGVSEFLTKPATEGQLVTAVNRHLG